jgi:XTP/dITP diphosphohydrolase
VLTESRGVIEGRIAPAPAGRGGFGYDPIFYYPPYGKTLAESSAEEKSRVSHRGQAFRQLRAWLMEHGYFNS